MSARVRTVRERPARAAVVVAAFGTIVLLIRPFVGVAEDARTALFALGYAAVAIASLVVPVERDRARAAPSVVLAIGLGAIVLAAALAGPPVPAPHPTLALPMSLAAAIAEEALFRRIAYGRLAKFGASAAIAGSAILFGAVHVPAYGVAALPVDLGAGVLLGWQRWASGTWLVPGATHAFANAVAILR